MDFFSSLEQLLLHCMIVNCMTCLFFSLFNFVQLKLNWTKRNITLVIPIQVCPHIVQTTRAYYRCEFAMCSWHLLCSVLCVWHTRRKIAQTHNRKSRKRERTKNPPTTRIFFLSYIIVLTSSNTNNTIAILESWK